MVNNKNIMTGTYYGLNYRFDKTTGTINFVSGKLTYNSNPKHFYCSFIGNYRPNSTVHGKRGNSPKWIPAKRIKHIKFGNVDTSNLTNMNEMFAFTNAISIDLGNHFNTKNVIDMSGAFVDSQINLKYLNLGTHFDTNKVTNMDSMFMGLNKLEYLNLGTHFDTHNVTTMREMFKDDYHLKSLKLGTHFDTSNVGICPDYMDDSMRQMFSGDLNLWTLNLGDKFDTSNVGDMGEMFEGTGLRLINLGSKFNTKSLTASPYMFADNYNLNYLNLGKHFDTRNDEFLEGMFENNPNLDQINLGTHFTKDGLDKEMCSNHTENMRMFKNDKKLKVIKGANKDVKREFKQTKDKEAKYNYN